MASGDRGAGHHDDVHEVDRSVAEQTSGSGIRREDPGQRAAEEREHRDDRRAAEPRLVPEDPV